MLLPPPLPRPLLPPQWPGKVEHWGRKEVLRGGPRAWTGLFCLCLLLGFWPCLTAVCLCEEVNPEAGPAEKKDGVAAGIKSPLLSTSHAARTQPFSPGFMKLKMGVEVWGRCHRAGGALGSGTVQSAVNSGERQERIAKGWLLEPGLEQEQRELHRTASAVGPPPQGILGGRQG